MQINLRAYKNTRDFDRTFCIFNDAYAKKIL